MDNKPYSDSRWRDNPNPVFAQCNDCAHYLGYGKCEAFEKIPKEIVINKVMHDRPYPGDNGIIYKKA